MKDEIKAFDAEAPRLERREQEDRAELVRAAPSGYRPSGAAYSARLRLILEESTVRVGKSCRYRAELQNTGTQAIVFTSEASFFKDPALEPSVFRFDLVEPGGRRVELPLGGPLAGGLGREWKIPGWEKMSNAERRAAAERENARLTTERARRFGLFVRLLPGETLVTRPANGFRELLTEYEFRKSGRHSIRLTFDDSPPQPSGKISEAERGLYSRMAAGHLGVLSSDEVTFEVRP